jgi:hypothetical protein
MASNEEIIRNLYAVAEKEPKRFRSLFTENGSCPYRGRRWQGCDCSG